MQIDEPHPSSFLLRLSLTGFHPLEVIHLQVVVTVCSAGISEETPAPRADNSPIGTLIVFLFSRDYLASNKSSSVTSDILPDSSLTLISSLFVFTISSKI